MKIYVIVSKRSETHGHGDYGHSYCLEMIGSYDTPPPAFLSNGMAEEYKAGLWNSDSLFVMELEVIPDGEECRHQTTMAIKKDKYGNTFECSLCGKRTENPMSGLWRKEGVAVYPDDPFGKRMG